jgi:hypothetical protein
MSLELLNYKHSIFLLLGVKLPKQRIINNLLKSLWIKSQLHIQQSKIVLRKKILSILKAMSRTTLVKYFIFTSTFNYFLQTWCGARIYFLDSQY